MEIDLDRSRDAHGSGTGESWQPPDFRQITLPAAEQAPGLARQVTRETLASWGVTDLEEAAVLLVSELITNSVRHACGKESLLVLRLEITEAWVRIEVHDADPRWPRRGTPATLDESGFGLVIVEALADTWGVRDTTTGKAVWAELPI